MPMIRVLIPLALTIACASPLAAADNEVEIEESVEALHQRAREANDLWTCLQLEAYGARHGIRLPASLGRSSVVHGDVLLGYSEAVSQVLDRARDSVVIAGQRRYRVAGDGRPLDLGRWLPFEPEEAVLSADGRHLALAGFKGPENQRTLRLEVLDLHRGRVLLRQERALGKTVAPQVDQLGTLAVAADGSAAAVIVSRAGSDPVLRYAVVATADDTRRVLGLSLVDAVGTDGAWLLAHHPETGSGCFHHDALAQPGVIGHGHSASGGGVAVMLHDQAAVLVDAAGEASEWRPQGLGGGLRHVFGIGAWLVVNGEQPDAVDPRPDSTDGGSVDLLAQADAPAGTSTDLFAAVEQAADQAEADDTIHHGVWLYRWNRLAREPDAAPALRLAGTASPARAHGHSVMVWHGNELGLLDLAGDEPAYRPFAQLDGRIGWVGFDDYHYVVHLAGDRVVVLDVEARELAAIDLAGGRRISLCGPRTALVWQAEAGVITAAELVVLAIDPAARRQAPLANWPVGHTQHHVQVDAEAEDLVVGSQADWMRYDTRTGRVVARGAENMPRLASTHGTGGRFLQTDRWARLVPVAGLPPAEEPAWGVHDATLAGRTPLVLDDDGRLHARSRRGWQAVGRLEGARHFVHVPGERGLFVGHQWNQAAAELGPGGELSPLRAPRTGNAMPSGNWQIDKLDYTVPGKAKPLRWDVARSGFRPEGLRGIGRSDLLVLTPVAVLQLDPATAFAIGRDLRELQEQRIEARRDALRRR